MAQVHTSCENEGLKKAMYVDDFMRYIEPSQANYTHANYNSPNNPDIKDWVGYRKRADFNRSILGNPDKEHALLWYCDTNKIDYLIMFGTTWIFDQGTGDENHIYHAYRDLLAQFTCKASQLGIEVGLALNENFENYSSDLKANRTVNEAERVTKRMLLEQLNNDTLWEGWQIISPIIDRFPEAEITLNPILSTVINIRNFNREIAQLQGRGNEKSGSCTGPLANLGIKAICTEYEWWLPDGQELGDFPDAITSTQTEIQQYNAEVLDSLFWRFDNKFLPYLQALNQFKLDGNIERVESYLSPWWYPGQEDDVQAEYLTNNYYENQTFDPEGYYYKFAAQANPLLDRWHVAAWSSTPWNISSMEGYYKMMEMIKDEADADPHVQNLEFYPIFYTESTKFIKEEDINPREDNAYHEPGKGNYSEYLGDLLNTGASAGGKSIQQVQSDFKAAWDADFLLPNAHNNNVDTSHLKLAGFNWFMWSMMPHMIYSRDDLNVDKFRLNEASQSNSNIFPYQLTDTYVHYFPDPADNLHTLEVYNPGRSPWDPNASPFSQHGNNYRWHNITQYIDPNNSEWSWSPIEIHNTSSFSPRIHTMDLPSGSNGGPANAINNVYFVQTTDINSCATTSIPVAVKFQNRDIYIQDNPMDTGDESQPTSGYSNIPSFRNIWVNQVADGSSTLGQIPGKGHYHSNNWVHVRIKNKGSQATQGGEELSVYFAKNGTDLRWPEYWIWNPVNGVFRGDRINFKPIYLPPIPARQNGVDGEVIIDIPWEHFPDSKVPVTSGVDVLTQFDSGLKRYISISANQEYNLLARIQRSETPPYGMIQPEETLVMNNVSKNNAISIKTDVKLEPNIGLPQIAIRPTDVLKSSTITPTEQSIYGLNGWSTAQLEVANNDTNTAIATLRFLPKTSAEHNILTHGEIIINLGEDLFNRWSATGKQGHGVEVFPIAGMVNSYDSTSQQLRVEEVDTLFNTIRITDVNAWIGGIKIPENFQQIIEIGMRLDSSKAIETDAENLYQFHFLQELSNTNAQNELSGVQLYTLGYKLCEKPEILKVRFGDVVNLTAHTIGSELAIGFQWLRNGENIIGAVHPNLKPDLSTPAQYSVRVIYDNGCVASSDQMYLDTSTNPSPVFTNQGGGQDGFVTGISDLDDSKIEIFPNPVAEYIDLNIQNGFSGGLELKLIDISGKEIITRNYNIKSGSTVIRQELTSLLSGQYIVRVKIGEKQYSKLIIKQ